MEKLQLIEWLIDDEAELRRISLVNKPAIEEDFMLFNSNYKLFKATDSNKRVITGVALRPNLPIYRFENGVEYTGFFSEDSVRKAAEIFFKRNSNVNNTNLEHSLEVEGVFVFESWIVEDTTMDKAVVLGFNDLVKGDWFVSMKIDNEVVWNNFLKTGIVKGFSVEVKAKERLSEVELSSNDLTETQRQDLLNIIDSGKDERVIESEIAAYIALIG